MPNVWPEAERTNVSLLRPLVLKGVMKRCHEDFYQYVTTSTARTKKKEKKRMMMMIHYTLLCNAS